MESVYTIEQEGYIEGNYSDLSFALQEGKFEEAESILRETRAKEFFNVAEDMSRMISQAKLNA